MADGMSERYLKELQQVLEAEAELAAQGSDLLADPEYRALRELFVDGDISLDEFAGRVEALSASRPDDDEADDGDDDGDDSADDSAAGEAGASDEDEDDWDDVDDDLPELPGRGLPPGQQRH